MIARRLARRLKSWLHVPVAPVAPGPQRAENWKGALKHFFAQRATHIGSAPTLDDLCFISGRDARLWTQKGLIEDLAASLVSQLDVNQTSSVLEVGCASGFIAQALAPHVGRYTGVDLAEDALHVAGRLGLANARFLQSDGSRLPCASDEFDAALCYDVFTNFPSFADGIGIIEEMLRVVRPGGRVLIGSIPDHDRKEAYEKRVAEVSSSLDREFGPAPVRAQTQSLVEGVTPGIVCYYFSRQDFEMLGRRLGVVTQVLDIHALNPYVGYRFNVLYQKPAG